MLSSLNPGDLMRNRDEIRFGGFVFDAETRDLRDRNGQRVELRNKSSEVLAMLTKNAGAIVSKTSLLEEIWPDVFVSDDSLTQCIGDIRRAIGDKDQSVIKTHVGKGYSLVADSEVSAQNPRPVVLRLTWPAWGGATVILLTAVWGIYSRMEEPAAEVLSVVPPSVHDPDKKSIAVLPFENIAGNSDEDWFADGMTADITTDLSQISGLFVIARNSSFVYKGQHPNLRRVSQELGVRYLLEGSVQQADGQVRITASLVDGISGENLWSERFDEPRTSVFELQDRIANHVVQALAVQLTSAEQEGSTQGDTNSAPAYEAFLRGREHLRRDTPDDLAVARDYFERAVELDPNYSRAHAALALVYYRAFERGWNPPLGISWNVARLRSGKHMMEAWKAPTSLAYRVKSDILLRVARTEEALEHARQAMALDPNDPENQVSVALALIYLGRNDEAVKLVNEAMRRDIHFPARYLYVRSLAKFGSEDFEGAVADLTLSLARNPENHRANAVLSAALAHLGDLPEAERNFEVYSRQERDDSHAGKMTEQAIWLRWPYKRPEDWQRFLTGIELASGKKFEHTDLGNNSFFEYVFSD